MSGKDREEFGSQRQRHLLSPATAIECLRTAAAASPSAKEEARIPLYWRIFGGTILSLVGMFILTVFQQLYSTLSDFRSELNRLQAARESLMTKEDFHSQMMMVWSNLKDVQSATASITVIRAEIALLEQRVKAEDMDQRELSRELQRLRERLVVGDGKWNTEPSQKADFREAE